MLCCKCKKFAEGAIPLKFLKTVSVTVALLLVLACAPFSASARLAGGGQAADSGIVAYGCDLSFWNVGGYYPDYSLVDFETLKADGCDYVILRVGFEGLSTRENAMDTAFLTLYNGAKAAGLDVGVYFYALATTYEGAAEDAQWCIDLFREHNMSFEYPIYYDVEDPGNGADRPGHGALTAEETTSLCLGWAETLEAAGYYPGVYGVYDTLVKLLPSYTDNYDVWYAYVAYEEGIPEFTPDGMDHSSFCGMWQYSWKGSMDGVSGELDVDVAYKDYPTIMRKNGYNNIAPVWESSVDLMPRSYGYLPYVYNEAGESMSALFAEDGTVTLTSDVTSAWAWSSAYMSCYQTVDLDATPLISVKKSGTSHFNAALSFDSGKGKFETVSLATLAKEPNGEFANGELNITVNMADYLRQNDSYPADGVLKIYGVTYYVMGAKGVHTTLSEAAFVPLPFSPELRSSVYTVGETVVSRIPAPLTVSEFFAGLESAEGITVCDADGQSLSAVDTVTGGMTAAVTANGVVLKSYTLSLIGDVNADGEATTVDARKILGSLLGGNPFEPWQQLSADFDGDGEANTADVRDLLCSVLQ